MHILDGIAVSPGVAIGEALVIDTEGFRIPKHFVEPNAVEDEVRRLDIAIAAVAEEIERNREAIARQLDDQYGAIFSAHLQMLRDPKLYQEVEQLIRERRYSAEYAVSVTLRGYAKVFQESPDPYMAERAHDIFDLERGLLRNLLGRRREQLAHLSSPVVVLAHNLTPSETAGLDPKFVRAFVTEIGGAGGHTAIVAKGLEIPAVVGIGRFLTDVSGGDVVIVDGDTGRVIVDPDQETLARYEHREARDREAAARLAALRDVPATTADGVRVQLMANIEFPHEVSHCLDRGADGIGLYRTEFLYVESGSEPSEEDHYRAYAEVVQAMQGRPVVIRTLDLGADKMGFAEVDMEKERNPFLGLRSIRLALRNKQLFRPQLRAILRASLLGPVKVMFPLISTLHELRQAKMVLEDAKEDLHEQGVEFHREIPVGMMVESPASVTMIDRFLPEVDFISIGTNDLIQYTLAVDRTNPGVADLYQATDPAVLRLIGASIKAADEAAVQVSLCGQMSGVPAYTMLLLGMGLREMSVPPSVIPEIKNICRNVTLPQCKAVAERAMTMDSAREIDLYLRDELNKTVQR